MRIESKASEIGFKLIQTEEEDKINLSIYDSDKVIGNIIFYDLDQPASYIEHLNVEEEYQHRGIGTSLLKEVLMLSKSKGCLNTSLFVKVDNLNAIRLYQYLGFVVSLYWPEEEKGYHYLMTRNLSTLIFP